MFGKRQVATLVAEFLGTGILTLLILSVKYSQLGSAAFFVAAAAGLTLTLLTFMFLNVSGGNFNPAVTIALWTAKKLPGTTAFLYVVVQFLGAYAAYSLVRYFVNQPIPAGPKDWAAQVMVGEIIGTVIFTLGIGAAIYQKFSLSATAAASGLALMLGIISVSTALIGLQQQNPGAVVGVLNPAVALGAKAFVFDFAKLAPFAMYVVGPIVGGIIGINGYKYLFAGGGANISVSAADIKSVKAKKAPAKKTAKKKPAKKK